jgi:hypothetical protein
MRGCFDATSNSRHQRSQPQPCFRTLKAHKVRRMAEPLGGETSKEVSEPQKKRSLFRKPIIAQPTEDHEQDEGVGFFSRAKDLYPMRLAEEERKRQKKLEKTERKRSTASPERKTSKTPEVKRRRISSQADDHSSNSSSNDDRQGEPPRPRRYSQLCFYSN